MLERLKVFFYTNVSWVNKGEVFIWYILIADVRKY